MRHAWFLLLEAQPAWLRMTRDERRGQVERHLAPLLARHVGLSVRHFDAEAFTTLCSDVMLVEGDDPVDYYAFFEALRDTPLVSTPWFVVKHIVPALEDGFRAYEARIEAAAGRG